MKKTFISIIIAAALMVSTIVPAVADEASTGATVIVTAYINVTLTDTPAAGLDFGSHNPDAVAYPEEDQADGTGALVVTVHLDSNTTVLTGAKALYENFGNSVESGTATGGSTITLINTGTDFVAAGVAIDDYVYNTTDGTFGIVTGLTGTTQLDISGAMSASGSNDNTDVYRVSDDATQWAVGSSTWDDNFAGTSKVAMTTTYQEMGSTAASGSDVDVDIYLWLAIPAGTDADTYYSNYAFKAIDSGTGL